MLKVKFGIRKSLGLIKRGFAGFFDDHFKKIPALPSGITSFRIGISAKGADIFCYRLGQGNTKVLFMAGIHGNEVGTVKLARYWMDWLYRHPEALSHLTCFIIPCLNPDGYALALEQPDYWKGGRIGRLNANAVDLNRNFDTPSFQPKSVWAFGKDYLEKEEVFCGKTPYSEPEIQALVQLIESEGIRIIFSLHNAGRDVMGNAPPLSEALVSLYAQKTGFRKVEKGHWKILGQNGTMAEWCDLKGIIYVEPEGSTRWGSDWKVQKNALIAALDYLNRGGI